MGRKLTILLAALMMVIAACTSETAGTTTSTIDDATTTGATPSGGGGGSGVGAGAGTGIPAFAAALQQFDQCDALLAWIQTEALERVGPYGFDGGVFPFAEERFAFDDTAGGTVTTAAAESFDAAASGGDGGGGVEFSTTNVQEAGVDEPDTVKTDGEHLFVLADNRLQVIEARPGAPAVVDSMTFEDMYPMQMLLGDDRLYVFASHYVTDLAALDRIGVPAYEQELFVVFEVFVGDDGSLTEGSQLEVSGSYVTGRLVDGGARIVVRHDPQRSLPFVYPGNTTAEERATEANREVVRQSTIEQWLPWYRLTDANGEESGGLLPSCDRVAVPQQFSGMSTVSVLSLDMNDTLDSGNALSLFGAADTVYASPTSLYAATYSYPPIVPFAGVEEDSVAADPVPDFQTAIHQFDISDIGGASYEASGAVPGHLLNQFAMSEHDGRLRVATTEGSPWWCCDEERSSSSVIVLEPDGDELVTVGSVGDLGVDEQIFGVRFVGDTGFVVTFRQTDPLYVIDLSDPTAPTVTGELEITGYSAYLHPTGDGYVIGVGQEATLEGNTTGTKVSLFDVRDPSDPREVDRWVLQQSNSLVEWDHKAFLYWAPEALAVVPVSSWRGDQIGAVALDVIDGSLIERGEITQGVSDDRGPRPGCEIVDRDDVAVEEGTELFWIFEEGGTVVRCDDADVRGLPGFYCEPLEAYGFGPEEFDAIVGDAEVADLCWPEGDASREIQRSVVIGDVLWTIGYRSVQANDLASLERLGTVDL